MVKTQIRFDFAVVELFFAKVSLINDCLIFNSHGNKSFLRLRGQSPFRLSI